MDKNTKSKKDSHDEKQNKQLIKLVKEFIHSDQPKAQFAIEVYKLYRGRRPNLEEMKKELGFSHATAYRNLK
jgi:hypothetical protein